MKINKGIVIVGAGITGLTLAERFANVANKKVLIVEKRAHIGGNCYDYVNKEGILVSKYGPHVFHTNKKEIWDYVKKFSKWENYEHRVLSKVGNRLVPLPVNANTINVLLGENLKSIEEMEKWLEENRTKIRKPKNGEEVVTSKMGKKIYELMFKYYTKKQWGLWPSELEPEVLSRIPVRLGFEDRFNMDKYQIRPVGGFTKMFKKMIDSQNIEIKLDTNYFDIVDTIPESSLVIFTGPINDYVYKILGSKINLSYRSLKLKFKTFDREQFQVAGVVNHPPPDVRFFRTTEYKHLTGQRVEGKTTVSWEYGRKKGIPYYPILTKKNEKKYQKLARLVKKDSNAVMAGRLGTYKYMNMDTAIEEALRLFNELS